MDERFLAQTKKFQTILDIVNWPHEILLNFEFGLDWILLFPKIDKNGHISTPLPGINLVNKMKNFQNSILHFSVFLINKFW